jgi:hypothetical protein
MALRTWWMAHADLLKKILALLASYASLLGLLVALLSQADHWPWWGWAILAFAGLTLTIFLRLEISQHRGRHIYAKTDTYGIRRYMHEWIAHGGRVAIWTRDMSWAQNPDTRQLLIEKAKRNELVLCLPECSDLASDLRRAGAEVCEYGKSLLESPSSRFTIALLGRDGSCVAVGRAEGDTHVIDEFNSGDHPAFHLAADLVSLVRALQREQSR